MKVLIKKLNPLAKVPVKAHKKDFCYDVYATSMEYLEPNVIKYGIGLGFQIVRGKEEEDESLVLGLDLRPRSSIYKTGLVLSNSIGTIDEEYCNEVSMIFYKVAPGKVYEVGDRIGQIKISATTQIEFELTEELKVQGRGMDGYGSSGLK